MMCCTFPVSKYGVHVIYVSMCVWMSVGGVEVFVLTEELEGNLEC